MNYYLAGKVAGSGNAVEAITELAHELDERGHTCSFRWWDIQVSKPYLDYQEQNGRLAEEMVRASMACDVFMLFGHDALLGASTEFGAAIASKHLANPHKHINVVLEEDVRQSIFYVHPGVMVLNGIAQIREQAWY